MDTSHSYEVATNLMRFGQVNGTYQYGGEETSIITLGRTGISHSSQAANGIISSTNAESLGLISTRDSTGLFTTQSYQAATPCEQDNFVPGGNNSTEERFPETTTAEGVILGTGTDGYNVYSSSKAISGKTLAQSASLVSTQGSKSSLIGDIKQSRKVGFNSSTNDLNFDQQTHDHVIGYSDESGQDTTINFLISDISVNNTLGEEVVNNSTSEEVLP